MKLFATRRLLSLVAVLAFAGQARATAITLAITEVMPSGSTASYAADWFELTNFGSSAVDITGFRIDDGSNSFTTSAALTGITSIAAGESVLFLENAGGTAISAFRTYWGGLSGVNIGYYSGSGLGLSTSGDGVNIFDGGSSLITGVTFGAATGNLSFDNHGGLSGVISAVSAAGQFGAFAAPGDSSAVGSPGAVANAIPEPSTYAAIFGALALGGAVWSRRRATAAR
jgi:hypothetical protein